jgi:L-ribulose-5-phosphate 3-epimerase
MGNEHNETNGIDRRRFLAATGLAAAATVAGASQQPATRREPLRRRSQPVPMGAPGSRPGRASVVRKALKFGMIKEGESITDKLMIARDSGFEGVEFDAPGNTPIDEILAAKEKAGVEIPGVVCSTHWSKPLSHPDERVRLEGRHGLEQAILTCRDLGGSQVLLVPAVVNGQVSYAEAYERSTTQLRRVINTVAAEAGVAIALENVWNNFLLSPIEASRYLDDVLPRQLNGMIDTPLGWAQKLGWYFDVGNIWAYGWPAHWLEVLGPQAVLRLDIKGYSRAKADKEGKWAGFGVEIGDGDVPWDSVRDWIETTNWSGWATAEVGGGDRTRLADISARMDRVLGLKN